MDNYGAFIVDSNFLSSKELTKCIDFSDNEAKKRQRVYDEKSHYGHIDWFSIKIKSNNFVIKKFCKRFKLNPEDISLAVFYYLDPGAYIHPHRDLSGASLNSRLRFHIPVVTNSKLKFLVNKEKVIMKPGELWILDTSYEHSVHNLGEKHRVHIVIDAPINKELKQLLPSDLKSRIHTVKFFFWGLKKIILSLLIDFWRNPKHFIDQMKYVLNFLKKKLKGKG